jgi:hypothetical protein
MSRRISGDSMLSGTFGSSRLDRGKQKSPRQLAASSLSARCRLPSLYEKHDNVLILVSSRRRGNRHSQMLPASVSRLQAPSDARLATMFVVITRCHCTRFQRLSSFPLRGPSRIVKTCESDLRKWASHMGGTLGIQIPSEVVQRIRGSGHWSSPAVSSEIWDEAVSSIAVQDDQAGDRLRRILDDLAAKADQVPRDEFDKLMTEAAEHARHGKS